MASSFRASSRKSSFPTIKTLDESDFEFALGVPKALALESGSLPFFERADMSCSPVPVALAKPI